MEQDRWAVQVEGLQRDINVYTYIHVSAVSFLWNFVVEGSQVLMCGRILCEDAFLRTSRNSRQVLRHVRDVGIHIISNLVNISVALFQFRVQCDRTVAADSLYVSCALQECSPLYHSCR
jgi:hypothetical protein